MAKKTTRKEPTGNSSVAISLTPRDRKTLEKLLLEDGQNRSSAIREALEALREKRRYAAKRSIERPVLAPQPRPFRESPRAREHVPNQMSDHPRVTTNLDPVIMKGLEDLAQQMGQTKAELLRVLIEDTVDPDRPIPISRDVVGRRTQVVFFSELFITALEDALDYDPIRHHNAPPPALRLDDDDYLNEVRTLVAELKRLNENLEKAAKAEAKPRAKRTSAPRKAADKSAIQVSKHVNTFLNKYAGTLGKGAAALTIATGGALLYQLGLPLDLMKKIRP